MQIKTFSIPVMGGELLESEMNTFLRSKKILQVENHLISLTQGAVWCFCIRYVDDIAISDRERQRVDYRKVLGDAAFKRFTALREIRKRVAESESVPAFVVFTDEELAAMAKMDVISMDSLKSVKGIGEKKVERYGHFFQTIADDEKS